MKDGTLTMVRHSEGKFRLDIDSFNLVSHVINHLKPAVACIYATSRKEFDSLP